MSSSTEAWLLVAHVVALLPQVGGGVLRWDWRLLLQFWNGMSSFGGLVGAFLGLSVYYWRARRSWLPTADVLVQALVVRRRAPGTSVVVLVLLYAPARFVLDFLRQSDLPGADVRHLGLTVAQYGCLVMVAVGVALALRMRREVVIARRNRVTPQGPQKICGDRASRSASTPATHAEPSSV